MPTLDSDFVSDSERALDLPIRANFNLYSSANPSGWLMSRKSARLLYSGFAVYSPLTLMSPAIMGLSTVSWYSASPWWSDVKFAVDLFFSQYKFLRLTALITQFLFFTKD